MCGIAGVISWDERFCVSREALARMSAAIAHRGPDEEGLHWTERAVSADRPQVALAFRRLAILDPGPRANQPFSDSFRRQLVFNGEIYNFRDLRAELSARMPDYAWRTTGDTETLLLAYDAWGEACVDHLNGMYAFAVWDEPAGRLFLARDRMGQKPLYYAVAPGGAAVAFASELGALAPVEWIDRSVSRAGLRHYLRWGYTPAAGSIYEGVAKLPPAMRVTFAPGRAGEPERYFDRNAIDGERIEPAAAAAATRRLVIQAVERQLVADVPLGCFLSGGMDSSIIAAAMRAGSAGRRVETFSIGFDDPRYDESGFARQVADHLGTEHHVFRVRPDAARDLPRLAEVFGEPFADSSALPTHYLSQQTRGFVKVALSGDGGDELFGGYDRYRAMAIASRFAALPPALRALITARLWQALPGVHPKSRLTRLKRLLAALSEPATERYASMLELFDDAATARLLSARPSPKDNPLRDLFAQLEPGRDPVETALAVDRVTYLPEDLLTKVDRASMLHALEVRAPFMDPDLVRFAAGLTSAELLQGGTKRMLREAFTKDLPAWVFKRRKTGFAVPVGDWFRGELRPLLRDALFSTGSFAAAHFARGAVERLVREHEKNETDHGQRLFALLMLELWWRKAGPAAPSSTA